MKEQDVAAEIDTITPLTNSIIKIILTPKKYIEYEAGQYLQVLLNDQAFSFSIANAPLGAHKYELHIRHSMNNSYHQELLTHIKEHGALNIRMPYGQCSISHLDPVKPILFIAWGTGFAPVKAMIEHLLATNDTRSFELFWGVRSQSDLYFDEKINNWANHVNDFTYYSLISDENKTSLADYVLSIHPSDLKKWQIVLSGPFEMVYTIRDKLITHGALEEHLFSDAFYFER